MDKLSEIISENVPEELGTEDLESQKGACMCECVCIYIYIYIIYMCVCVCGCGCVCVCVYLAFTVVHYESYRIVLFFRTSIFLVDCHLRETFEQVGGNSAISCGENSLCTRTSALS